MDDLAAMYKILKVMRDAMDYDDPDLSAIQPEALGVSKARWRHYLEMLTKRGYIEGIEIVRTLGGGGHLKIDRPRITFDGLEYLEQNTLARKAYRLAKGIKDAAPGT